MPRADQLVMLTPTPVEKMIDKRFLMTDEGPARIMRFSFNVSDQPGTLRGR